MAIYEKQELVFTFFPKGENITVQVLAIDRKAADIHKKLKFLARGLKGEIPFDFKKKNPKNLINGGQAPSTGRRMDIIPLGMTVEEAARQLQKAGFSEAEI